MPTRTTARPAPTTSDLRAFLAGLGSDSDAAILRAVACIDALQAPYAPASRRACFSCALKAVNKNSASLCSKL
mgnify:CR=1 FL=1